MWKGVLEGYELLGELDGDKEEGLGGHEKGWEGEVVGGVWEKMGEGEEIDDGIKKKNDFWLSD